jgi:hypothetical protein
MCLQYPSSGQQRDQLARTYGAQSEKDALENVTVSIYQMLLLHFTDPSGQQRDEKKSILVASPLPAATCTLRATKMFVIR